MANTRRPGYREVRQTAPSAARDDPAGNMPERIWRAWSADP